jgi:formate--tetrahydrofolate ligase
VTEGGFGLDLGGEKFLDIKCRALGAWPRLIVLVATLRALKFNGGVSAAEAKNENQEALTRGLPHLLHHMAAARRRGLPVVVVLNRFPHDSAEELELVRAKVEHEGGRAVVCEAFAKGGEGAMEFAEAVLEEVHLTDVAPPEPNYTYELDDTIPHKLSKVARAFYGASGVVLTPKAEKELQRMGDRVNGLPVCIAKTQLSLTDDPEVQGRPSEFTLTVRELRLSAGAGFVVALTGEMMTMPGLPREPAARGVRIDPSGKIRGLMQND